MLKDGLAVGRAALVIALGFVVAETAPGRWVSDGVASALAAFAVPLLRLFDPDIVRIGTEIRGAGGWAVRVTEVCDGHGLVISLLAVLACCSPSAKQGAIRFAAGFAAIQVFNLARIVSLALLLAKEPSLFDPVHARVFPLLTSALIVLCVLDARPAFRMALITLPLVLLWLPVSDISSYIFAAPANLLLGLSGDEFGRIAERAAGWTLGTNLLATAGDGQMSRFLVPLRPADFTLALPVVLGAAIFSRRYALLLPAVALMLVALMLAGMTAVWTLGAAQPDPRLLLPDGSGSFTTRPFRVSQTARDLAVMAQNVLIHLNLLVLPALVASAGRKDD